MILEQIGAIVIPRSANLERIDPDGTRPFEDVLREVRAQAWPYYNLVVDPLSANGKAESAKFGVVKALDIYESFHMVSRQTSWAVKDPRVPFRKYADGAAAAAS